MPQDFLCFAAGYSGAFGPVFFVFLCSVRHPGISPEPGIQPTYHFRLPASFLFVALSFSAHAARLNDTGQTLCYDSAGAPIACTAATDDGRYGRDTAATAGVLSKTGAGVAGFDFTKIANNGSPHRAGAILGASPADRACTRDNVTGLTWQVKPPPPLDLRYSGDIYTWYNANAAENGGNAGNVGANSCNSTTASGQCNTAAFVAAVNAANLCGASDWRLASLRELKTMVNLDGSNPAIDTTYFPNTNTVAPEFWSASTHVPNPAYAWYVGFNEGGDYDDDEALKSYGYAGLVRGGQF